MANSSAPSDEANVALTELIQRLQISNIKPSDVDYDVIDKSESPEDPATASKKQLNAWVLTRVEAYSMSKSIRRSLFGEFQEDFEG